MRSLSDVLEPFGARKFKSRLDEVHRVAGCHQICSFIPSSIITQSNQHQSGHHFNQTSSSPPRSHKQSLPSPWLTPPLHYSVICLRVLFPHSPGNHGVCTFNSNSHSSATGNRKLTCQRHLQGTLLPVFTPPSSRDVGKLLEHPCHRNDSRGYSGNEAPVR